MKKRFVLAGMLSFCILFVVSVSSVNAARGWYANCVVTGVATDVGGNTYVNLSGGVSSLPAKWYTVGTDDVTKNRSLATCLTAISMGATMSVDTDPAAGTNPLIYSITVGN
jgi:hypothetical protein